MLTMEKAGDLEQLEVVDDGSDSQCCSGSQSGWTLYLEQSLSLQHRTSCSVFREEEEEEEEEDLSMLSDASSGPPHAHDDEENYCSSCSDAGDRFVPLTRVPKHENKRRRVEEGHREEYSGESAGSTLSSVSKAAATTTSKKSFLMDDENSGFSATHF